MSSYQVGSTVRRLCATVLASSVLARVSLGFNKPKPHLRGEKPWVGGVMVLCSIIGLAGNTAAEDENGRGLRPHILTDFPEAKLSIYVPERPTWSVDQRPRRGAVAVILSTPSNFYPPASIELVHNHSFTVSEEELADISLQALSTIRKASKLEKPLAMEEMLPFRLGGLTGYEDRFVMTQNNVKYSVRSMMGVFDDGSPLTVFILSGEGGLQPIEHMVTRILRNTKPLRVDKTSN